MIKRAHGDYGHWAGVAIRLLNHSHACRYWPRAPYTRTVGADARCVLQLKRWFRIRLNRFRRVRLENRLNVKRYFGNPIGLNMALLRQRRRLHGISKRRNFHRRAAIGLTRNRR